MALLSVNNLRTYFHTRNGIIRAVDGISFDVGTKEILGVVGESGSGKSVLCRSIMELVQSPPGRISFDGMEFDGAALSGEHDGRLKKVRGNSMTMIFQDPMTSLNPYMRISDQLTEPMIIHRKSSRARALEKAVDILTTIGIPGAAQRIRQYPHEFSGGMRQRVCIAMALMTDPKLMFADEPTTALDVTVQAQILSLLRSLQERFAISIVLVTHDFGIVAGLAHRIMVMYAGTIVEFGPAAGIFSQPMHPYTKALLRALPARARPGDLLYSIPGQPPEPGSRITGCPFAPRCEFAVQSCTAQTPSLKEILKGHSTACQRMQRSEIGNRETGI
jgi:oligopeptide transport system ATP-binding protein